MLPKRTRGLVTAESHFSELVSLACHDLRTPLATAYGFARTITRSPGLDPTLAGYSEMIETASGQLGELIDELSLAARIAGGRYEPKLEATDTAVLAAAAVERLGEDRVGVSGSGGAVAVDLEATKRSVSSLVQCALRHGGLDRVEVALAAAELRVSPITPSSAPVVLGEDLRDLGAAVAVMHVQHLGGSVAVDGETLVIGLPA
jgi:signal transduction histidine kinase